MTMIMGPEFYMREGDWGCGDRKNCNATFFQTSDQFTTNYFPYVK